MIATGKAHTVKEFLQTAFDYLGLDYNDYLTVDDELYRPSEVNTLQGDASKAHKKLNWFPTISFENLVQEWNKDWQVTLNDYTTHLYISPAENLDMVWNTLFTLYKKKKAFPDFSKSITLTMQQFCYQNMFMQAQDIGTIAMELYPKSAAMHMAFANTVSWFRDVDIANEFYNKAKKLDFQESIKLLDPIVPLLTRGIEEIKRIEQNLRPSILDDLGLTGAKFGCGEGLCGACMVLLDEEAVPSCQMSVGSVAGRKIKTIEGLARNGQLHPIQRAFIKYDALQCGFCTPGMILKAYSLLVSNPMPTRDQIISEMDDNLCRCGAHVRIVQAIQTASKELKGGRP